MSGEKQAQIDQLTEALRSFNTDVTCYSAVSTGYKPSTQVMNLIRDLRVMFDCDEEMEIDGHQQRQNSREQQQRQQRNENNNGTAYERKLASINDINVMLMGCSLSEVDAFKGKIFDCIKAHNAKKSK